MHQVASKQALKRKSPAAPARSAREGAEVRPRRLRSAASVAVVRAEVVALVARYDESFGARHWEAFLSCLAERIDVRFEPSDASSPPEGSMSAHEWATFLGGAAEGPRGEPADVCSVQIDGDEAEVVTCGRPGGAGADQAPARSSIVTYECRRLDAGWKITAVASRLLAEGVERGPEGDAFDAFDAIDAWF